MNTLDLNGTWQIRWFDGQRGANRLAAELPETDPREYLEAEVPGEVHLDLIRAGLIADTNDGANVLAARWVEECYWTYRRVFDSPEATGRAWLVFERLFLHARIVLNGEEIGTHGNAFRPCRIDVTGKLRPSGNVLVVHIESGLFAVSDKDGSGYAHHEDALLHKRSWLRAPQCQFGWDWSPRLLNVGISGDVRLEWTEAPVRLSAFVPLATLDDSLSHGEVEARVFLDGLAEASAEVEVSIPELGLVVRETVAVKPGEQRVTLRLAVESPERWNPVGHGAARRYDVTITVRTGDSIETSTKKVGFRHVLWDQSPHPERGTYFRLIVNGQPVFCKGGNFVPADTIFARLDWARYQALIRLALEANFNFLRVWGGGLYESDDFYDLCDEAGILVWQEFIYACAKYPMVDEAFHEEAKREARHQIRRLGSHASLVAWCGNNEMEEGNWHWGYDKRVAHPDYAFFHLTLPRLMAAEDPTRYYQPSSPISPGHQDPHLPHTGDQHPWTIGFFNTDTRGYRSMADRFPNEGGVMGPTTLTTLERCLQGSGVRSLAWRTHDNSITTWREPGVIDAAPERFLGKSMDEMTIEEFVYWGAVVQGEGLKEYVESFRRRMFDTAAAIFWMFNDTWPAVRSWTIVDYDLRRCPSFHYVRRAMASIHVILAVEGEDVLVFGVNDTLNAVAGSLRFGVMNLARGYPVDRSASVELGPNARTLLARFPMTEWESPTRQGAFAFLDLGSGEVLRNRLFLPLWREMEWPSPDVRREGDTVVSSVYVPGVCLGLNGEEIFDLYPDVPVAIPSEASVRWGNLSRPGTVLAAL